MRQKLYEYLLERPAGASPHELLDLIFTQPGADPEFGPRFVHALLASDTRFVWRAEDGTWNARVHEVLARPLGATTFVVVDLETTGTAASAAGIIEIGAARVRNGQITAEFQQLINPRTRLPPFITRLTGIHDAMLAEQPPLAEIWPRFIEFVGDAVIVAHNAGYDLGFLNAAAVAVAGRPLPNPHLCTIKLARRLVPTVRRRALDALAAHFGIPLVDRHRALGDVRITVEVFFHLLERMASRGVARLDQALDLQRQARDGRPFVCPLPRDTVERLPAAPGIYRFFGADGRLLYIGKARDLRQRVGSYLSNAAGHSKKTLDLIRHSRDVRVEITRSDLEAALEEAAAIRREQPPYNRLGKHLPRIAFLKLAIADPYPRLSITTRIGAGTARYVGPFRDREEAERARGVLTRLFRLRTCPGRLRPDPALAPCFQGQVDACTAPCAARVSADSYRRQVSDCLALLDGDARDAESELTRRRDDLAAALSFEAAARVQRDLKVLRQLMRRQRTLGWVTAQRHFLVLQPSVDRDVVLAYAVLGGRLAIRRRLNDESQVTALAEQLREQFPLARRAAWRDTVDGTTILAAWLRDRRHTEGCVFPIETPAVPAIQVAEWRAACASLLAPPAAMADGAQQTPADGEAERDGSQPPDARGTTAADGAD